MNKNTAQKLGWLLVGITIMAISFQWFDPEQSAWFPPCPLNWSTGWYCPGCGSMRALHSLFHGDLKTALFMNPLMVIALPFLFWMIFEPRWMRKPWAVWLIFTILVAYGIFRNLPFAPFQWLTPGMIWITGHL